MKRITISPEILERFEQPEEATALIQRYAQRITAAHKDFADKTLAMLHVASNAPQKISLESLRFELEGVSATMRSGQAACPESGSGHGPDDDLSNSFNDKESTFFDAPTWRG